MRNDLWTREELILTLNLYMKLPFGKLDARTKEVKGLANLIGRTPSAVSYRLNNFAHVDEYHRDRGIRGLSGGYKVCKPIWDEFLQNRELLTFESEKILAQRQQIDLETKFKDELKDLPNLKGEDKIRAVKTRVNQSIFRQMVLVNYSSTCAISGIAVPDLLGASHIIPWSKNETERLNPENGLCLSAIHDRAFDKGLIGIDLDSKLLISRELAQHHKSPFFENYFGQFENKPIELAGKYLPRKEFLEYHLQNIYKQD